MSSMTEGSTWAVPCYPPCTSNFSVLNTYLSSLWMMWRAEPLCNEPRYAMSHLFTLEHHHRCSLCESRQSNLLLKSQNVQVYLRKLVYLHQPVSGGVLVLPFGKIISELLVLSVVCYSHLSHNHFSLSFAKLSLLLHILFLSFCGLEKQTKWMVVPLSFTSPKK
jgi:hypothetical protein